MVVSLFKTIADSAGAAVDIPDQQTSNEGDVVLDPFMGSGTTGRVCDKLGRSFVGYDLKGY